VSETLLPTLIFLAAMLYASVGHGGASGYLAAMALLHVAPATMKPAALALNILVSLIAFVQFWRAGHFDWQRFWPFAVTSVPCAYFGGLVKLPDHLYKPILAAVLVLAALRLLITIKEKKEETKIESDAPFPRLPALCIGAGIGILSGLTGVGGGIFLTPLLLFFGWMKPKEAAATSALFIFVNSLSGLFGHLSKGGTFPQNLPLWAICAVLGGSIGAYLGTKKLPVTAMRPLLAVALVIAAIKMLL
jgi:uncharacterized protein